MNLYTKRLVEFIKANPKKDNATYCQRECHRCNFYANGCERDSIEDGVCLEASAKESNVNSIVIRQESIIRVNAHLREVAVGWIDVIEKLKFLENLK
jgi:hypothetical protein